MIETILKIFAGALILVGILGFVVPPSKALTSGASAYNVFHLVFGAVGGVIAFGGNETAIRTFLVGFGLIDLYQYVANWLNWFPKKHFRWKPADDALHIVVGLALVAIGIFGSA